MRRIAIALAVAGFVVFPAAAQEPPAADGAPAAADSRLLEDMKERPVDEGYAVAVDSDVVVLDGVTWGLYGIDAFDREQTCFLNGKPWSCGAIALRELEILVDLGPAVCTARPEPDPRRPKYVFATCVVDGKDLSEEMVRRGMALAARDQTQDYVATEGAAHAAESGMWQGLFIPPWDFRARYGRGL